MTSSGVTSSFSLRAALAVAMALATVGCGSDTTTPKADGGGGAGGVGVDGTASNTVGGTGGSGAGGLVPDGAIVAADASPTAADGPAADGPPPSADVTVAIDVATPADGPGLAPDAQPINLCGNGVKDPGETCDITAKDPAARCPDLCPVQSCTTRKLINAGTCMAQCVPDKAQTACANGDGCCPAGCNANNDDDCPVRCDNGVQEAGETCDPLTNCPKSCPRERCEIRQLVNGNTCQAECRTVDTVKTCIHNDGCCPPGCTNKDDNDCDPNCDNGVIEAGETCDPRSTCPTQATCVAKGCQRYELKNPDTCKAECVPSEIFYGCVNGDGCCPSVGCNNTNDSDCKPVCGNGVVEADELCEPGSGHECPSTCPAVGCNLFQPQGPDKCHVKCEASGKITGCSDKADSCCPAGCNALMGSMTFDADCMPVCGNGIVEKPTETCEGAQCDAAFADCVADKDHTIDPIGMVGTCNFDCRKKPRACMGGDNFCPTNCTHDTDSDCKSDLGAACGGNGECGSGICMDGVCCSEACTGICRKCLPISGLCVNIDSGDDTNPLNACGGANPQKTCAHGQCLLKNDYPCDSHIECISDICEAGKCRAFNCHADQQWTTEDICKTKLGFTCSIDVPCLNNLCDYAGNICVATCDANKTTSLTGMKQAMDSPGLCKLINAETCSGGIVCASGLCEFSSSKCVGSCGPTETTSMDGDKPMAGDGPGVCKLINGQMCGSGLVCASGVCDPDLGVCVKACAPDKMNMMGLCKCPDHQSVNADGKCKNDNGGACTVGADCASGICNGFNNTCASACVADAELNGDKVCQCVSGKAYDPTGVCKTADDGSCSSGSTCAHGICNLTAGGGKCDSMCAAPKHLQAPSSTCACTGANEVPSGDSGCDCAAGFARDVADQVCKGDIGHTCSVGADCALHVCSASACATKCPDFQVPDSNGVCVAETCTTGATCQGPKFCQDGLCVAGCDGSHYLSDTTCKPKKATGDSCSSDTECTTPPCAAADPAMPANKTCS
jgi:hypothetical protein